ncbi:hypothetical protein DV738_g565, partial [Chaetothyriales sp. CBS 135597]
MPGKGINNSKSPAIAVPEQPDLESLIAALEELGASKKKKTISAATPPVTEVEDREINRRQWYHVTQTNDRGIALTAARRIPAGTLILFEPALLRIPLSAENDGTAIDSKVNALSKPERKKFMQLFNPKPGGNNNDSASKASGIYNSNCYNINAFDDEGGSCVGLLSARINHSCLPNIVFSYVPAAQANALRRGMMQFHAIKNISKGKELVSNYEKSIFVGRKTRIERLRRHYGFDCSCLLLKEGLIYTPLANCYKSLAKWSSRMGQNARPWLEKEHEVVIRCFGRDSPRAQLLAAQLSQKGG